MSMIIGILLFLIFLSLSAVHVYWGFGGRRWIEGAIPSKDEKSPAIRPGRIATLGVALILIGFALFALLKSMLPEFRPEWLNRWGLWFLAIIFLARAIGDFKYVGVFRKYKGTPFGMRDRKLYSPLCLVIAILCVMLELLSR